MKAKSDSRNWERDKTGPTFTGEEGAVPGQALAEVDARLGLPLLRGLRPLGCLLILCHAVWIRSPARRRSGTAGGVQNSIRLCKSSHQVVKSRDPPYPAPETAAEGEPGGLLALTCSGWVAVRRLRQCRRGGGAEEEIVVAGYVDELERLHRRPNPRSSVKEAV
jgi:hypothetical protein